MSLIEQLGGYEKAKEKLSFGNSISAMRLSYETTITNKDGTKNNVITGVYLEDLDKALLEYRREHGIYEVGDRFINYADDSVYTVLTIDKNNQIHGKSGEKNVWTYFGRFGLRHATDEEIAAGRIL